MLLQGISFAGWTPLSASDWAAWVQAIGSIVAILVALITVGHQVAAAFKSTERQIQAASNLALKAESRERFQKLKGSASIIDYAAKYVIGCAAHAATTKEWWHDVALANEMAYQLQFRVRALQGIDLGELGADTLIIAVQEMIFALEALRVQSEAVNERIATMRDGLNGFIVTLNATAANARTFKSNFDGALCLLLKEHDVLHV